MNDETQKLIASSLAEMATAFTDIAASLQEIAANSGGQKLEAVAGEFISADTFDYDRLGTTIAIAIKQAFTGNGSTFPGGGETKETPDKPATPVSPAETKEPRKRAASKKKDEAAPTAETAAPAAETAAPAAEEAAAPAGAPLVREEVLDKLRAFAKEHTMEVASEIITSLGCVKTTEITDDRLGELLAAIQKKEAELTAPKASGTAAIDFE